MRKLKRTGVILVAGMFVCTLSITHANTQKRTDVRGVITHISRSESQKNVLGTFLVEGTKESDTQVDKANLTVRTNTKFFIEHDGKREPARFADLKEGQQVEVSFTGPLRESYPVQTDADEVTILSSVQGKVQDNEIVAQLKQATQELLDAIAPGNKSVWQRYLAAGSVYADEEGRVLTREQLLEELKPLPKGYVGSIRIGDTKAVVQDNVVVLSHRDREELELYNQKIVTYYHMTNTWARQRDGQWQLVATHVMAIPNERKPAAIDPKTFDIYIGQYELAPDVTYVITREGDKLFGQRTGRPKDELLPLCVDVFYRKGVWRGEKVFERDAQGRVVRLLDRRENNDLVWKKVK